MVLALGYLSPQSRAPVLALSTTTLRRTSGLSGGELSEVSVCLPACLGNSPYESFLGIPQRQINSLSALGEAWPLEGGAVHLWGHCWPGGTVSTVEQAELLDCYSLAEPPVVWGGEGPNHKALGHS